MAKLYFRYGTMGSAKSSKILVTAYNYREQGMFPVLFTHNMDDRFGESVIASRMDIKPEPAHGIDYRTNLYTIVKELVDDKNKPSVVLCDEVQFYKSEQIDQLSDIVDKLGIPVICYGLRTDFRSKTFEGSKRLLEIADEITEEKAMCKCGSKASVNARFSDDKIVTSGDSIQIGDLEYKPMCRSCWKKEKDNV